MVKYWVICREDSFIKGYSRMGDAKRKVNTYKRMGLQPTVVIGFESTLLD